MSEQRFKKGVNLSCIDTETGKTYWYACNLRGLLNELAEENEQLKNDIQKVYKLFENYRKVEKVEEKAKDCLIDSLKEENKRLKFELKRICNLECENCKEEWCEKK